MTQKRIRPLRLACGGFLFGIAAFGAAASAADQMYVKSNEVVVREGKGPIYDPVATVHRGEAVTVVERQGKWLKVNAGGRQGWVFEDALSPRALDQSIAAGGVARGGGLGASAAASGAGLEHGPGAELSLRGGGWDAAQYAARNGLRTDALARLKALRAAVTGKRWEAFAAEGHVGPQQ